MNAVREIRQQLTATIASAVIKLPRNKKQKESVISGAGQTVEKIAG